MSVLRFGGSEIADEVQVHHCGRTGKTSDEIASTAIHCLTRSPLQHHADQYAVTVLRVSNLGDANIEVCSALSIQGKAVQEEMRERFADRQWSRKKKRTT